MSSTRTLAQPSAAAGFARAAMVHAIPVSVPAIDASAHVWTDERSLATGTKRYGSNPSQRPEEAGP